MGGNAWLCAVPENRTANASGAAGAVHSRVCSSLRHCYERLRRRCCCVACAMAEWPDSSAWLVREALPARLLAAATADSDAMAAVAPNFWVPREAIEAAAEAREAPRTLAEQVVFALHGALKEELPADWAGAEWWCQVYYEPKRGLKFHWDKDEELMKATGRMRHPALSCVIYLNSAEECAAPPLGATLVMQQHFDAEAGCGVPEPSRHDVLAWPSPNCVLVFDGALAHGVLDSASTRVRRTMLVNWWRAQPQGVQRERAEEYVERGLAPPLPADALAGAAAKAERVSIAVCELRAAEDCAEGPVPLEEALTRRGCGPAEASAAALHHPDCVIWQVETAEEDGDGCARDEAAFKPLVAALIPDELAEADESSSSESSESE